MALKKINFTVSVTPAEAHELERAAKFNDRLITEYIKETALSEAYRPQVRTYGIRS